MQRSLLFFLLLLCSASFVMAQSASLSGIVLEEGSKDPVISGSVALYQNGDLEAVMITDIDGKYKFANLDPGTYDVEFSYVGLNTVRMSAVQVFAGKANKLDAELPVGVMMKEIVIRLISSFKYYHFLQKILLN